MAVTNPLEQVKKEFGDKEKLIAAVEAFTGEDLWVARTNKSKGLSHVSNAKLLRLHRTFSEVKDRFGTREKLIDAILELMKRSKDDGFKTRLGKYPVPRLYDLYKSTAKRHGIKVAKPAGEKPAKAKSAAKAPAPKAEAKSAAKKAPASKKASAAKKKG
jgi:hypothetical protein